MASVQDKNRRWGVIVLAHGAPDRLEDIPAFLLSLRNGRPLPKSAVEEIVERYRLISARSGGPPGEASPLTRLTHRQAASLEARLGCPVYVGMRNWRPYIADTVRQAAAGGLDHVTAVCLAPQNSRTSVGLYGQYLEEAREKLAPGIEIDFIESWHDHPGLVDAFRERVAAALGRLQRDTERVAGAGAQPPVIFTAHSVPERTIREGDPYEHQVRETAGLVARALGLPLSRWSLAFQSQGMTPEPWIGPTVESEIGRWAAGGDRQILIAPVGFVCDHVEILYDIDVVFRKYGEAAGLTISRTESLNDSPLFVEALANLVTSRAARWTGAAPAHV
jgi:protoporphyrin/coproporphyrin ferrochelatase